MWWRIKDFVITVSRTASCNLRNLFLDGSLESSTNISCLNWVIGAASREFKQILYLKKVI